MSLSGKHKDQDFGDGVHVVPSWSYADTADRVAHSPAAGPRVDPNDLGSPFLPLVASDVYKFAVQLDNNSIWMLVDHSPITWVGITDTSSSVVYTVPSAVALHDFIYLTGDTTADRADNSGESTIPAVGIVISKPTATTAVIATTGEVSGLSGMTPGSDQFLGTLGGIIEPGSLPTSSGSIVQLLGQAVSATTILLGLRQVTVL